MRIGLQVPSFTYPGGAPALRAKLAEIAKTADDGGFYSLWVMDHFFQIGVIGPAEHEMLEGYTTLAFFAAQTQHVKLGTLVTGVVYRHPGILVKTVTTLDVLSGGRAYLGIGAAWFEREALGLGVPYPSTSERFEQLEETLQIAHQMWRGEVKPFTGKHFTLQETLNSPQPISAPHPPIMIGGMGEQKTMRLIAQYGNACNMFAGAGTERLQQVLDALRGHCDTLGRDYASIEKTALDTVHLAAGAMTADDVIKQCESLAAMGFQHVIFNMPNVHEITPLETFANTIIPAVAGL